MIFQNYVFSTAIIEKIRKSDKSTFFPDNWDEIKVMSEIGSALNNRVGNFIENTGVTSR